jgi:hypothetical protein
MSFSACLFGSFEINNSFNLISKVGSTLGILAYPFDFVAKDTEFVAKISKTQNRQSTGLRTSVSRSHRWPKGCC